MEVLVVGGAPGAKIKCDEGDFEEGLVLLGALSVLVLSCFFGGSEAEVEDECSILVGERRGMKAVGRRWKLFLKEIRSMRELQDTDSCYDNPCWLLLLPLLILDVMSSLTLPRATFLATESPLFPSFCIRQVERAGAPHF